jgi:hypothetical protein
VTRSRGSSPNRSNRNKGYAGAKVDALVLVSIDGSNDSYNSGYNGIHTKAMSGMFTHGSVAYIE